jgi:hypothetical protein
MSRAPKHSKSAVTLQKIRTLNAAQEIHQTDEMEVEPGDLPDLLSISIANLSQEPLLQATMSPL